MRETFNSKADNAETKSVPNSGRSSQTSKALTQQAPTAANPTCGWSALTSSTTRRAAAATCPAPCLCFVGCPRQRHLFILRPKCILFRTVCPRHFDLEFQYGDSRARCKEF